MSNMQTSDIVAVIVTHQPDMKSLERLITILSKQVGRIIIVDNGSKNINDYPPVGNELSLTSLNGNFGIAYAQNVGILEAMNEHFTHVLLMDQDSIPSDDMVERLGKGFNVNGVIAVGPTYIDTRSGKRSFFIVNENGLPKRVSPSNTEKFIEAAFLISSGTLIDLNKFKQVRGKRSDYFIDHVDTEWTIRARLYGYRLLGMVDAIMYHSLGDQVKQVWFFGMRQVSYHSPLRDYYMFRNTLLMLRDVKMNWLWRVHFIWRLLQFASYFLLFSTSRKERFLKMTLGVWHGIKNVRGRLESNHSKCIAMPKTSIDP